MSTQPILALHYMDADGSGAPQSVHLVPAGTFKGTDGRGPYHLTDPAGVIRASMVPGKLPIDVNHSTDLAAPSGQPSPAVGWIVELQPREDGIWGRVEWTEQGAKLIGDRAYRGISPALETDKEGNVVRLLRAALTNAPNLPQLTTLHSQVTALVLCRGRADAVARKALQQGKIDDANIQTVIRWHMRNPAGTEAWLASLAEGHARKSSGTGATHDAATVHDLTPSQHAVCERMGIDPERFLAHLNNDRQDKDNFGLTTTELQMCEHMHLPRLLFASFKQAKARGPKTYGLSAVEQSICNHMGLSLADLAAHKERQKSAGPNLTAAERSVANILGLSPEALTAHKERQKSVGPNLTAAERSVANILGLSPEALTAYKRGGEAAARAMAKLSARRGLHAQMRPQDVPPEILALLRKFGLTVDDLEKRKILPSDLVAYDKGGLTRDDIEYCRRERVNPLSLIRAREYSENAPLWRGTPG